MDRPLLTHNDYTVACICPMGVELAPVDGNARPEAPEPSDKS